MKIWVVSGCVNYEGCAIVGAFDRLKKAEAFKKSCELYDERKPLMPDLDDDVSWDKFEKAEKKWRSSHPAKAPFNDYYIIDEIDMELDEPEAK